MKTIGQKVYVMCDQRISHDLWGKSGTLIEIKPAQTTASGSYGRPETFVVQLDDPKRDGRPDMPVLQCEEWALQ